MGHDESKNAGKLGNLKPQVLQKQSNKAIEPTPQEYSVLSSATKFSETELRRLWVKFTTLSNCNISEGRIGLTEFQFALGLKSESFARRVFAAFDNDGSQEIDFSEFCHSLYVMSPRASLEDKAKFCFAVYDIDGNGEIDRQELRSILMYSLSENSAVKLSDEQLIRIIDRTYAKMDTNSNGGIDFEEFREEAIKNPAILACATINLETVLGS
jgi:Ca2+-binding EF-hand superfamily protein